jgi:hypothetical protein
MASVVFDKHDLYSLIEHHIALLERFNLKDEAPFALIYFNLGERPKIDHAKILHKILRRTDALFQDKEHFVVLLPGTDWNGATELLSGIQEFLNQAPDDNIATYPEDGINAEELMQSLQLKVEENSTITAKMLAVK